MSAIKNVITSFNTGLFSGFKFNSPSNVAKKVMLLAGPLLAVIGLTNLPVVRADAEAYQRCVVNCMEAIPNPLLKLTCWVLCLPFLKA